MISCAKSMPFIFVVHVQIFLFATPFESPMYVYCFFCRPYRALKAPQKYPFKCKSENYFPNAKTNQKNLELRKKTNRISKTQRANFKFFQRRFSLQMFYLTNTNTHTHTHEKGLGGGKVEKCHPADLRCCNLWPLILLQLMQLLLLLLQAGR